MTKLQVLAGLHERFVAIKLNILSWSCTLFYTIGTSKLEIHYTMDAHKLIQ